MDVAVGIRAPERFVPVFLIGRAVTHRCVHFDALLGHFGNDVHDSSHRVRAVKHRRGTAHDFDPFDVRDGKAGVIDIAVRLSGHAFPVHQKQDIARIEPLERERRTVTRLMELDACQFVFERLLDRRHTPALEVARCDDTCDDGGLFECQRSTGGCDHDVLHFDRERVFSRDRVFISRSTKSTAGYT